MHIDFNVANLTQDAVTSNTMRAAWFDHYGAARDVLSVGDWPTPEPVPGEVLVRLYSSGVNPSDVKKRAGLQPALDDGPVIPHSDGAGVVEQVGKGGPQQRVGERVWVYQAQFRRRFGTAAQYVSVPQARAVSLPDNAGFEVGACLGIPVMTAHRCVFADGPVTGCTVLVTGGAGRVGFYAVQLAKWGGARVVATVGSEASAKQARKAGADEVLSYGSLELANDILETTNGEGVDRIIDVEFGANVDSSRQVLKANGVIATYSSSTVPEPVIPFYAFMFNNVTLRTVLVYDMPEAAKQAAAKDIVSLLADDMLLHRVAKRWPLAEVAGAHEAVERGNLTGSAVVDID